MWCNGSTIDFGSISSSSNLDTLTIYFSPKNKLLEKDLEIELAKSCFISSYDLHSQVFSLENSKIIGFKGNMHIRFKANEMVRRILGMLLSYSQYAGIGIKTALGMGAVDYSRRIA